MTSFRATLVVLLAAASGLFAQERSPYEEDLRFAAVEIEKVCGDFIKEKKIDWRTAARALVTESKNVKTDQEHLVLLTRLLARLNDGHAAVLPLEKGKGVRWPTKPAKTGPGMFLCQSGKKLYVKNSWSSAKSAGLVPGMELVKVNRQPATAWLAERISASRDLLGFSTDHQAFFYACHWGLQEEPGTDLKLEVRTPKGRKQRLTLTYTKANPVPSGPAFFPGKMEGSNDVRWTTTNDGWGYIHIRRCPGNLPELIDSALASLQTPPGIILDFRGNSGGGIHHPALMGRFVPKGETLAFAKRYESAGEHPYGGPVVAIIDGTVRSAGETAAAIFKEDGRAYLIGESPTAGMSASKTTVELPSKLFSLYVSVASNMKRSNGGRGLEGIGILPHETVAFASEDLAAGVDTLISVAEERLKAFPQDKVPYKAR